MLKPEELKTFIIDENASVMDALGQLNINGHGVVFAVNEEGKLTGSIADGDIRRFLLKNGDLKAPVRDAMWTEPKVAYAADPKGVKELLKKFPYNAVPILDEGDHVVDVVLDRRYTFARPNRLKSLAGVPVVIMAGGKGTRLYPYTKILPKPLIPINDTPIIERVIGKFTDYGVKDFYLTVNYKKELIKAYFGDLAPDYNMNYVEENMPLGTGGSLKLIDQDWAQPIFVTNCDTLIEADYAKVYEEHIKNGNAVTMIVSQKKVTVPYGVVHPTEDGEVDYLEEKPSMNFLINTGMYVLNPEYIDRIPDNVMYHMPTLIEDLMKEGKKIGVFPIDEDSFLDMGEFEEMQRMEEKLKDK